MPKAIKVPHATAAQIGALRNAMLHCAPGAPMRWPPEEFDAAAPDWCCPGCARTLLIGAPPKTEGLLLDCTACGAIGIVPPVAIWPA